MDERAARAALGVAPGTAWEEVRTAYRRAIRAAHPDVAGGSTARAASLNAAYAVLVRARRGGSAPAAPPPPPPSAAVVDLGPIEVLDGDTVHLAVPPDEAFLAVLEACHRIGDVTYVDRRCAILEALVAVPGEGACSLVVTFQGRVDGTDAFCTLEAIEHVGSPPIAPVTAALSAALRSLTGP